MDRRGGQAQTPSRGNDGFTMVELLIVIVVLGLLSAVTVFAVRGITHEGGADACDVELTDLMKAQDAHLVLQGSYASEADLVATTSITSESTLYDVSLTPEGGYSVTPSAGSECTMSATGHGDTSSGPIVSNDFTPITSNGSYGTISGVYQLPQPQGGPTPEADEILVLGRADATADFNAVVADGTITSRRVTFISLDNFVSEADVRYVLDRADANGLTDVVIYAPDDVSTITKSSGGTWDSVTAFVTDSDTQLAYPGITPRSFAAGSGSLIALLASSS